MDIYRKRKIEKETNFSDFFEDFEETVVDDFDLDCLTEKSLCVEQLTNAILQLPEQDQLYWRQNTFSAGVTLKLLKYWE